MRRAPSAASSRAEATPRPPAPPTSTTSLPRSDSSSTFRLLFRGDVPATGHDQEHGQDFAVAEIVLEDPGDHGSDDDGNGAMQDETAVGRTVRESAQCLCKIREHEEQH